MNYFDETDQESFKFIWKKQLRSRISKLLPNKNTHVEVAETNARQICELVLDVKILENDEKNEISNILKKSDEITERKQNVKYISFLGLSIFFNFSLLALNRKVKFNQLNVNKILATIMTTSIALPLMFTLPVAHLLNGHNYKIDKEVNKKLIA